MNRKNVRAVANALLNGLLAQGKHPVGYNQHIFVGKARDYIKDETGRGCGTVACIAGHAFLLAHPKAKLVADDDDDDTQRVKYIQREGAKFLGLKVDDIKCINLFQASPLGWYPTKSMPKSPTAKQAALVLFNLAETGKVNWEAVR